MVLNTERAQTQERQIFDEMQAAISQFMNTTKWTNDAFKEEEKIKCNILITFRQRGTAIPNFAADVQIQSLRPVFNSDYETPVFNFLDTKWQFQYTPDQPLIFAENTFTTELTSLLAFYAYIIIGLDYDTFAPKGGDPFYQRALNIVNNSQQAATGPGWDSQTDTRNRYWLMDNLNSPQFEDFRLALYDYHRLALDSFDQDPEAARKKITECLEKMEKVRQVAPTSATLNAFFDAKLNELINIYERGDLDTRNKAVGILSRIDPSNAANYRRAIK